MVLRQYTIISPHHITISHFSSLLPTIISLLTFNLCTTLNINITLHLSFPLRFILTLLILICYYLYILFHMKKVIALSLFLSLSLSLMFYFCVNFLFFVSLLQIDKFMCFLDFYFGLMQFGFVFLSYYLFSFLRLLNVILLHINECVCSQKNLSDHILFMLLYKLFSFI